MIGRTGLTARIAHTKRLHSAIDLAMKVDLPNIAVMGMDDYVCIIGPTQAIQGAQLGLDGYSSINGRNAQRLALKVLIQTMSFDILASPLKIGRKTAPNRFVNHPMECNDSDASGNPTELTLKRYRDLAKGGAGIITVESLTVTSRSRSRKNQLEITERNADGLEMDSYCLFWLHGL